MNKALPTSHTSPTSQRCITGWWYNSPLLFYYSYIILYFSFNHTFCHEFVFYFIVCYVYFTVFRGSTNKIKTALQEMWKWGFLLIGSVSEIRNGFICIWNLLSESGMLSFFQILLISSGDPDYKGWLFCNIICSVLFMFFPFSKFMNTYPYQDNVKQKYKVCLSQSSTGGGGGEDIFVLLSLFLVKITTF